MILLEYITVVYQHGDKSYQISGHTNRNQNPAIIIRHEGRKVTFNIIGINAGQIEDLSNQEPRENHLGIYISLDNLTEQISKFPIKLSPFAYPADPPVNYTDPRGTERRAGARVHMVNPLYIIRGRNLKINFCKSPGAPGAKIVQEEIDINLDIEHTPRYVPIISLSKWFRTTQQLHIGIGFSTGRTNNSITIPRISFEMSYDEYDQFIEALRVIINGHTMGY
ncbi:hypothetical protein GCM10027049_05150 [Mucilaginibacter puniceus]